MIEVILLPERRKIKIDRESISIAEILEMLELDDLEGVAILVNDRLVDDQKRVIKSGDRVVLIRQATGGV